MAIRTLGLTGRNYSTLASAAAFYAAQSFTENEVLEVYNDGGPVADTVSITLGGWTANGFSLTIRPASGQGIRHNVDKLTNAYRYNTANGAALTNSIGYADAYILTGANLRLEDLQIRASSNASSSVLRGGSSTIVDRCILFRSGGAAGAVVNQAANIALRDSLILHGAGGNAVSISGDNVDIDNCTLANLAGGGIGIQQSYTQSVPPRVRNTAFRGFTTAAQGSYRSGSTNNATTTASWTGTGISGATGIADTQWENVTAGTEDFRLRSTASATMKTGGAAGVGSGLDGVGTSRGATNQSIGAWEAPGVVGPSFTASPSNQTVTQPAAATFSATYTGTITGYQVQQSTDGGSSWGNVPDGTGASGGAGTGGTLNYTTTATAVSSGNHRNAYRYRFRLSHAGGTVDSAAAVLTVNAPPLAVTLDAMTDESGNPRASYTVDKIWAIRISDNTLVATWTSQTTNGSGVLPALSSAALTAVPHEFVTYTAAGLRSGAKVYTPS